MDAKRLSLIKNYLANFEVRHRDVQAELLDHFATSVQEIEEQSPQLTFVEAMMQAHRNFGGREGFRHYLQSAEKRVNQKVNRVIAEVLKSFLHWPYFMILLVCTGLSFGYSHYFNYGELSFGLLSLLFVLQALALFLKFRHTEYFLVWKSLRQMGWLFYLGIYLPHYFLLFSFRDGGQMPFGFQVFCLSLTLCLWSAFWQVPGKLEHLAEREYPRPMA